MNPGNEFAEVSAVLAEYFDGLHFSDTTRLRAVFNPQAQYFCATDGTLLHLDMEQYFPLVNGRPSPASQGQSRTDRIVSVEFAGPVTAVARVECSIPPKHFQDLLALVKLEGRWQIVSKVFHYTVAPEN